MRNLMMLEQPLDFTQATDITMQTYRQIAASYAQRHDIKHVPSFWQEHLARFVAQVQSSPGWQANAALPVLDAGCGPGRDSLLLAQRGFIVQAIDLSEGMLAQARQHCFDQPGSERITFRQMDMRHLELPDASCAGAWISASFLHIPKKENLIVLSELVRVLAPGGALTLLVKEADSEPDERYDPAPEGSFPRFFARYHGGELWNLLEQAGLSVISLTADRHRRESGEQSWLAALALKPV
jgi:ubiquinone/menaquinone biosynthesis C-methylase UbiE